MTEQKTSVGKFAQWLFEYEPSNILNIFQSAQQQSASLFSAARIAEPVLSAGIV